MFSVFLSQLLRVCSLVQLCVFFRNDDAVCADSVSSAPHSVRCA